MIEFLTWDFLVKIPMITEIRIVIYLGLAVFGGAGLLYDKVLNPFLTKNEQKIDDVIELLKARISYALTTITGYISALVIKQFTAFIRGLTAPQAKVVEPKIEERKEEKKEDKGDLEMLITDDNGSLYEEVKVPLGGK